MAVVFRIHGAWKGVERDFDYTEFFDFEDFVKHLASGDFSRDEDYDYEVTVFTSGQFEWARFNHLLFEELWHEYREGLEFNLPEPPLDAEYMLLHNKHTPERILWKEAYDEALAVHELVLREKFREVMP